MKWANEGRYDLDLFRARVNNLRVDVARRNEIGRRLWIQVYGSLAPKRVSRVDNVNDERGHVDDPVGPFKGLHDEFMFKVGTTAARCGDHYCEW